jgi:hypothetical protein
MNVAAHTSTTKNPTSATPTWFLLEIGQRLKTEQVDVIFYTS